MLHHTSPNLVEADRRGGGGGSQEKEPKSKNSFFDKRIRPFHPVALDDSNFDALDGSNFAERALSLGVVCVRYSVFQENPAAVS